MDDQPGTYAPQSPDLSQLQSGNAYYPPYTASANSYNPSTYNHEPSLPSSGSYPPPAQSRNGQSRAYVDEHDPEWAPSSSRAQGHKAKKQKVAEVCEKPAPGVLEGIEVKTKFPVARIKRIMQADEDVGKVAQVTPTAVSKALELFMISLVTIAADEAKSKSSKRITAAHLKQAMEKDVQWDFLAEIIAKAKDPPSAKKDEDSEEAGEGKKRRGGTRKQKTESSHF